VTTRGKLAETNFALYVGRYDKPSCRVKQAWTKLPSYLTVLKAQRVRVRCPLALFLQLEGHRPQNLGGANHSPFQQSPARCTKGPAATTMTPQSRIQLIDQARPENPGEQVETIAVIKGWR